MTLRTVKVPPEIEGPFADAEAIVSRAFADKRSDPTRGTIEIIGERYILVRAAALSVEFFSLVSELYGAGREREADEFTRNILFDLAHSLGKTDAQVFSAKMGLADPIAKLSAGPIHFAHTGWAFVDISSDSRPVAGTDFYLLYDHPYSFESDAWLRSGKRRDTPACIMNAGYSSGWCEASFGVELVSTEIECRARGDAHCRFVMAHPAHIERFVANYLAGTGDGARLEQIEIPDFFSRKRAEEELRRAHEDLERRVAERTSELSASNARLREEIAERQQIESQLLQRHKLEAVGRLAGGVAHDFNNLMAVIIGNCALLARDVPSTGRARGFVDEILHAGERAAALTRQLLTFSRAQPRSRQSLDLNAIVRDLTRILERVLGEDLVLDSRLAEGLAPIDADRSQIEQVIMNLAVNARDAMPDGGTITIATENAAIDAEAARTYGDVAPGDYVILSVTDRGTGISADALPNIFDPFFTTKEIGKGTGLGLATVYGIVRQTGGAIAVSSAPGEGASFRVLLPRAPDGAPVVAGTRTFATSPRGTETILLVEDEPRLLRILAEMLRDQGYVVVEAQDGIDAIDRVRALAAETQRTIDLLVTDVVMPRMGGVELAAKLRAEAVDLRVLFISGYADAAAMAAEVAGGAGLLQKPFTPDALQRKVRELLGATPRAPDVATIEST